MVVQERAVGARKAASRTATISAPMFRKVGDEALRAKTGRVWRQWIALLDKVKAYTWTHAEIARYLQAELGVSSWWSQSITIGYEQAKGLRVKHERPDGFEISVSRTLPMSLERVFDIWGDDKQRRRWLAGSGSIRTSTSLKSMRFNWAGGTIVEVRFYAKGDAKCQVVVQHMKLPRAAAAERAKAYWAGKLANFPALVKRS